MIQPTRIARDPAIIEGKPCIRGMKITVGTIVELLAAGHSEDVILDAYLALPGEDIFAALSYAAWRAGELALPLAESYTL